jgi:hypothetical protein
MQIRSSLFIAYALLTTLLATPRSSFSQTSASGSSATALCSVDWGDGNMVQFDLGSYPSISINNAGAVVELNTGLNNSNISYRVGELENRTVSFQPAQSFTPGYYPSVSMNTDGFVIEVHTDRSSGIVNSKMFYALGKLAPNGRSLTWFQYPDQYDGGFRPQVAMNDSGWVVEVHETSHAASHQLLYRLGKLGWNPTLQRYALYWASGDKGIGYDEGRFPHVTLDNAGNVIEVHQASTTNNLHYRRGRITNTGINFAPAASNGRYQTGNSAIPAIAASQDGFVQEIHTAANAPNKLSQVGQVNWNTNNVVDWATIIPFGPGIQYSLSTNGSSLVYVDQGVTNGNYNNRLRYIVGAVNCP